MATQGKSADHEPRTSRRPPIGGPATTPRFDATRTDAYADSCRSGATRSATIACETEPPSEPIIPASASSASPTHFVSDAARKRIG